MKSSNFNFVNEKRSYPVAYIFFPTVLDINENDCHIKETSGKNFQLFHNKNNLYSKSIFKNIGDTFQNKSQKIIKKEKGLLSELGSNIQKKRLLGELFLKVWRNNYLKNKIIDMIRATSYANDFQYENINNPNWMIRNYQYYLLYDKLVYSSTNDIMLHVKLLNLIGDVAIREIARDSTQRTFLVYLMTKCQRNIMMVPDIIDAVAEGGHLEVLKTLHYWETSLAWGNWRTTTKAVDCAAEKGFFEVVQFLLENRTEGFTERAPLAASRLGNMKLLQLLAAYGPIPYYKCVEEAATWGHLNIIIFIFYKNIGMISPIDVDPETVLMNGGLGFFDINKFQKYKNKLLNPTLLLNLDDKDLNNNVKLFLNNLSKEELIDLYIKSSNNNSNNSISSGSNNNNNNSSSSSSSSSDSGSGSGSGSNLSKKQAKKKKNKNKANANNNNQPNNNQPNNNQPNNDQPNNDQPNNTPVSNESNNENENDKSSIINNSGIANLPLKPSQLQSQSKRNIQTEILNYLKSRENKKSNKTNQIRLFYDKKLLENQISTTNAMHNALLNGHMDCVIFLEEFLCQPFELTDDLMIEIAMRGNLSVLQYLKDHGVDISRMFDPLCYSSNFQLIEEILYHHRDQFSITTKCFEYAAKGNQTTISYLLYHTLVVQSNYFKSSELIFMEAMDFAAKHGNVQLLSFIHAYFRGVTNVSILNAVESGNMEALKWVQKYRLEPISSLALTRAFTLRNFEMAQYLFYQSKCHLSTGLKNWIKVKGNLQLERLSLLIFMHNKLSIEIARPVFSFTSSLYNERLHGTAYNNNYKTLHGFQLNSAMTFSVDPQVKFREELKNDPLYCPNLQWKITPDIFVVGLQSKHIVIIDIHPIHPKENNQDIDAQIAEKEKQLQLMYQVLINHLNQVYDGFKITFAPLVMVYSPDHPIYPSQTFTNAIALSPLRDSLDAAKMRGFINKVYADMSIELTDTVFDNDIQKDNINLLMAPTKIENYNNLDNSIISIQAIPKLKQTPHGNSNINATANSNANAANVNANTNAANVNANAANVNVNTNAANANSNSKSNVNGIYFEIEIQSKLNVNKIIIDEKISCDCKQFKKNSTKDSKEFCQHISSLITKYNLDTKEIQNQDSILNVKFKEHFKNKINDKK